MNVQTFLGDSKLSIIYQTITFEQQDAMLRLELQGLVVHENVK